MMFFEQKYEFWIINSKCNQSVDEMKKRHDQYEKDVAKAEKEAKETNKASAKAKLIAGEALTEEEANTIVL